MVHTIYLYDRFVGTSIELYFQYSDEDSDKFNKTLKDFEWSLSSLLSGSRYLFINPLNCDEYFDYSNLVVDCDTSLIKCLADYTLIFFKMRGFIG